MSALKKLNEKKFVFFVFVLFFVFNFVQIFAFKMYVQSDDLGYIANAAYFAGYNWNPYTGDMTQYFNIGFPISASWVFKIFNNPIWIYRGLLFVIIIWQMVLMCIVYRIIYKQFRQNKKVAICLAFVYSIGSMAPQNGLYFMAEIPFALCTLLILYILGECSKLDSKNNSKKRKVLSSLCAIILAYSYSVHTRFLVLFVAVIVIVCLYKCIIKKDLIDYTWFAISFVVTFAAVYGWINFVQDTLYATSITGKDISSNNALSRLAYIPVFLKTLFGWDNMKKLIWNYASLLSMYTLLTGGLFCVVIIKCFAKFAVIVKKVDRDEIDKINLILLLGGFISFFGMNLLVAMNGVTNATEYKWLTYFRYAKPFIGILFIVFLNEIYNKRISNGVLNLSMIGVGVSVLTIFRRVIFILNNALYADVSPVGWMQYYFYNGQSPKRYFSVFAIIVVIIFILFYFLLRQGKNKTVLIFFVIYSILLTLSENRYNMESSERNYEMVDSLLGFMAEYEDQIDIPIYFLQGTFSGKIRYALGKTQMNYILDSQKLKDLDFENAMVFSDVRYSNWGWNMPKYIIKVDDYEYIYTSNKEVYTLYQKSLK